MDLLVSTLQRMRTERQHAVAVGGRLCALLHGSALIEQSLSPTRKEVFRSLPSVRLSASKITTKLVHG